MFMPKEYNYINTNYVDNYAVIVIAHCLALLPYCVSQSIWLEKYLHTQIQTN